MEILLENSEKTKEISLPCQQYMEMEMVSLQKKQKKQQS